MKVAAMLEFIERELGQLLSRNRHRLIRGDGEPVFESKPASPIGFGIPEWMPMPGIVGFGSGSSTRSVRCKRTPRNPSVQPPDNKAR